jgi:hypothetical protein
MANKPTSIGAKIDAMFKLREEIRKHEAEIKEITAKKDALEAELLEQMDKENVTKSTGGKASVTVSENIKPSVEDWDSFYKYISKTKQFHLLERRPSVTGCRELFEKRGKIPGVVPFTKRVLTMRSLS